MPHDNEEFVLPNIIYQGCLNSTLRFDPPLYSFPPFRDVDERTMTAIYRQTGLSDEAFDTSVKIALIGCPKCWASTTDDECHLCGGRRRIPIIDRTMTDVEITQRDQSLAQRKGV